MSTINFLPPSEVKRSIKENIAEKELDISEKEKRAVIMISNTWKMCNNFLEMGRAFQRLLKTVKEKKAKKILRKRVGKKIRRQRGGKFTLELQLNSYLQGSFLPELISDYCQNLNIINKEFLDSSLKSLENRLELQGKTSKVALERFDLLNSDAKYVREPVQRATLNVVYLKNFLSNT